MSRAVDAIISEANAKARLSAGDVRTVRRRYAKGASQRCLGSEYGVCKSTIGAIVRRETWSHLNG